jgi:hypothetical protein
VSRLQTRTGYNALHLNVPERPSQLSASRFAEQHGLKVGTLQRRIREERQRRCAEGSPRFCGTVSAGMEQVRQLIAGHPEWSRRRISQETVGAVELAEPSRIVKRDGGTDTATRGVAGLGLPCPTEPRNTVNVEKLLKFFP